MVKQKYNKMKSQLNENKKKYFYNFEQYNVLGNGKILLFCIRIDNGMPGLPEKLSYATIAFVNKVIELSRLNEEFQCESEYRRCR